MERLAKLRSFAEGTASDLRTSLEDLAADLSSSPLSGQLAIIIVGAERRTLLIDLDQAHVEELTERLDTRDTTPDFIVYVKEDSLEAILRGHLSPLEALLRGNLRYAGNEALGVDILRRLASTQDAVFEPCRDESW